LGSSGIIHHIYNTLGVDKCKDFLNNTQALITNWMITNSFSIGFGDAIINKEARTKIKKVIEENIDKTKEVIIQAQQGIYDKDLSETLLLDSLETKISEYLNNAESDVNTIIKENINKDNGFWRTITSGSKGNMINIMQIMGLVGQQRIWGSRITYGLTDRTLPSFHRFDIGASSKGFCKNCYMDGLSPAEFFFASMGGRAGVIDTAVRTAESGYISRRLIKGMEELS